jgi:small subunit ribosomal protein S20
LPIIKSARKRVKVAEKATIRNAKTKRQLKESLKALTKETNGDNLRSAISAIDKAAKKHVIHKNKAARLKSRASKLAKDAKVSPVKKAAKVAPTPKAKATTAKPKTAAKPKAPAKKKPAKS